jgi:hypothetical protein
MLLSISTTIALPCVSLPFDRDSIINSINIILEWIPPERRERGKPETSRTENIRRVKNERKLQDERCHNRIRWKESLQMGHSGKAL